MISVWWFPLLVVVMTFISFFFAECNWVRKKLGWEPLYRSNPDAFKKDRELG